MRKPEALGHLALENDRGVDGSGGNNDEFVDNLSSKPLRVDRHAIIPAVMTGCQSRLERWLEGAAVFEKVNRRAMYGAIKRHTRVLLDVSRLVIDDGSDERGEVLVGRQQ
jgi:hypothetical protein